MLKKSGQSSPKPLSEWDDLALIGYFVDLCPEKRNRQPKAKEIRTEIVAEMRSRPLEQRLETYRGLQKGYYRKPYFENFLPELHTHTIYH